MSLLAVSRGTLFVAILFFSSLAHNPNEEAQKMAAK
jgi:hypothetical protein